MKFTRRNFTRLLPFLLGLGLANCNRTPSQSTTTIKRMPEKADLVIWWEQGYLAEENERMIQLVHSWEQQSGQTAILKLMPTELIEQELLHNVQEPEKHKIPDVVYSLGIDTNLAPKLAWRDQLSDLSELIEPLKQLYTPVALSQVSYHNQVLGQRRYYAVPLWQSNEYIHCWQNLLAEIGLTVSDIPREWHKFWQFWQTAQEQLRAKRQSKIYGLGLCMSTSGFDTHISFMLFLDAYDVTVVDQEGRLLLATPENREKFIDALEEFTSFYLAGYVPPAAVEWTGSGNNLSFLDSEVLMTYNLTLSIPLTQKLEPNQYNQDAITRYRQIVTLERPQKVNGQELLTRKGIKQAIIPKASKHQQAAQEFLLFLLKSEKLNYLIKGFKGRLLPVMPHLLEDPLWQDPSDRHLAVALKHYHRPSSTPYEVLHPAFSEVISQQLWAKTILKVVQANNSSREAADWAIAQIQQIWTEWERNV